MPKPLPHFLELPPPSKPLGKFRVEALTPSDARAFPPAGSVREACGFAVWHIKEALDVLPDTPEFEVVGQCLMRAAWEIAQTLPDEPKEAAN